MPCHISSLKTKSSFLIKIDWLPIFYVFQPEEEQPDRAKELEESVTHSDLFSQLTPEDVREVIESVAKEMLGSLQVIIKSLSLEQLT